MLETKLQRVFGEEHHGRSLVRYMKDLGVLSERMNIIHAVWVDESDMDLIAAAGSVVAHNPISNLRLGSGGDAVSRIDEPRHSDLPRQRRGHHGRFDQHVDRDEDRRG